MSNIIRSGIANQDGRTAAAIPPGYRLDPLGRPALPPRQKPSTVFRAMGLVKDDNEILDGFGFGSEYDQSPYEVEVEESTTFKTGVGGLENLGIGPGRITLVGAPPKYGKTSLVMQLVVDALRSADLIAFVANAEMSRVALMQRQVCRLSGVPLELMRKGGLSEEAAARVQEAKTTLYDPGPGKNSVASESSEGLYQSSLLFCCPPFNTLSLTCSVGCVEHHTTLSPSQIIVVIDYVQLFSAPDPSKFRRWKRLDRRQKSTIAPPMVRDVGLVMADLRALARTGIAIVAVLAMSRDNYDTADVSGFRGSSELEYGCDDAYLLAKDQDRPGIMHLRHVASRNSETRDRVLRFDGAIHRFTSVER